MVEAVTLAGNADEVRREISELRELALQAETVEESESEAKLTHLRRVLEEQGFFENSELQPLIFTEFRDTLDYLLKRLESWGFKVGSIHGGMRPGL